MYIWTCPETTEKHTESISSRFCSDSHNTMPNAVKKSWNGGRTLCLVCFSSSNQTWVFSWQSLNPVWLVRASHNVYMLVQAESRQSFAALRTHSTTWAFSLRKQCVFDYLWKWSKVDKLKTFYTPFTPVFSIVHLWSDWPKCILIPGGNGASVSLYLWKK